MAKSVNERVVQLLLIIKLVKVASGALVHVATIAVEHVVRLGHAIDLFTGNAKNWGIRYRPFGNLGAFIRPKIGLKVFFFDFIRVL